MLNTATLPFADAETPAAAGGPALRPHRAAHAAQARARGFDWTRVAALSGAFLAHAIGLGTFWLAMADAPPLPRPQAAISVDDRDAMTLLVDLSPAPPPILPQPPVLPAPPPPAILLRAPAPVPPRPVADPSPVALEASAAPAPLAAPAAAQEAPAMPAAVSAPAARAAVDPARARDERAAYVRALMAALLAQRTYPAEARRQRARGVVAVRFTLDRQGHVLTSSIARSPGYAVLEQAALEVLHRADPLPAIPDALGVDRLTVTVPIEYSLITR